jgi:hypothetical protein
MKVPHPIELYDIDELKIKVIILLELCLEIRKNEKLSKNT